MRDLDNPIEFARHRRQCATPGEFLLWQILRDRQRCKMKFRREHPLGPYTCDFYCAEVKLDIECDGKDHFTEEGQARDAIRDAWMKRHGVTTLRFTNQQIENDTQTVMNIIDGKLLELASPSPPAPLPEDGERGASLKDGFVCEKRPSSIHEQRPAYVVPSPRPISAETGASLKDGSVGEKRPSSIREQCTAYVLSSPRLISAETGASLKDGFVCEKRPSSIHEQRPAYVLPSPRLISAEIGASLKDGFVREKRPSSIHKQRPAYVLSSPRPISAETGASFKDGFVREERPSSIHEQRPAYVLSPPRPVFGERGSGGEGENARNLLITAFCQPIDGIAERNLSSLAKAQAKHVGFTLIELLVTLVIVSVLAAATLPAFKNVIVERKTSVAALEVKAFLDAARARAIARGRPVSVILERLSSRSDGLGIDGTPAYLPDNPFRSITAQNPSAPLTSTLPWTTGDATTNFGVYNACIRMVMAESMRPIEFELTGVSFVSETAGGVPPILNDGDGLVELGRIMVVPNNDNRLATNLRVGNEIEILTPSDDTIRFLITNVVLSGTNFFVSIRNEGSLSQPYGTILDVNRMASSQEMVSQFAFINSIGSFRVLPQPRPVASMVTELPRGSCIDLSLSGLSNDDPNVNPTNNLFRDCRREFASDWVLPRTPAFNDLPPLPSQLRPVYLTFGPTGKLSSVLCNAPQLAAPSGNPASYTSNLRRIEPQSDVCLFVGRNDQVIAAASTADLAAAEDASLKPNLMDATGYWIRVSPTSGIISAAPAQASHIIEDVADFRGGNPPEPIGHLLEDSRSLIFEAELTSQ